MDTKKQDADNHVKGLVIDTELPSPEATILERILWVRARVTPLEKDVLVEIAGNQYEAISHDQVTAALRDLMCMANIYHDLLELKWKAKVIGKTQYDKDIVRLRCQFIVTFKNASNPDDSTTQTFRAEVMETGDKGPQKLYSYLVKIALQKVFMTSTGENEEQPSAQLAAARDLRIGDDENLCADIETMASDLFGSHEKGMEMLTALAKRGYNIEDGNYREINALAANQVTRSLKAKAEQWAKEQVAAEVADSEEAGGDDDDG